MNHIAHSFGILENVSKPDSSAVFDQNCYPEKFAPIHQKLFSHEHALLRNISFFLSASNSESESESEDGVSYWVQKAEPVKKAKGQSEFTFTLNVGEGVFTVLPHNKVSFSLSFSLQ